jgi:hypothetical protein
MTGMSYKTSDLGPKTSLEGMQFDPSRGIAAGAGSARSRVFGVGARRAFGPAPTPAYPSGGWLYGGSTPMHDRALSNVLVATFGARLSPSSRTDWTGPGSWANSR